MNKLIISILLLSFYSISLAQNKNTPIIGAEVWIEPGQTPEQIDNWFKILKDNNMPCARVFMMWNYMQVGKQEWDFKLYDQVFAAAEKYGVKIQATLTAHHGPAFLDSKYYFQTQGGSIPQTDNQKKWGETYIQKVVERYKNSPALENWWLHNEPGQMPTYDSLSLAEFRTWLSKKYENISNLNQLWITNYENFNQIDYKESYAKSSGFFSPQLSLDWSEFWRYHLTNYLIWVAENIKKYDKTHPLHVNPHAVLDIPHFYQLPKWGIFLNSLGASLHPSWHFSQLKRNQYGLGICAVSDITKGAIYPKPFWISELQGGNNTYSGMDALCPTPNDIAQWVWSGIGSGAQKVIYWSLNVRKFGGEAGEWSLLTYQDKPSERLKVSSEIAKTIHENADYFENAKPQESRIYLLLSTESIQMLGRKTLGNEAGRKPNAIMQSLLGYYFAMLQSGINPNIVMTDAFDWEKNYEKPICVILPNVLCVSMDSRKKIEKFVAKGNKLIIDGNTAFFDEFENNTLVQNFGLEKVFGAKITETKWIKERFDIDFAQPKITVPAHIWINELETSTAQSIATYNGKTIATRNQYLKGEAVWIPSHIGLAAFLYDEKPLSELIINEITPFLEPNTLRFNAYTKGAYLRILETEKKKVAVLSNSSESPITVSLVGTEFTNKKMIWNPNSLDVNTKSITIEGRQTIVLGWDRR